MAMIVTMPELRDELVSFSSPMVQSYKDPVKDTVFSSRIHITPSPINATTNIEYDMSCIEGMSVELEGELANCFTVSSLRGDNSLACDIKPVKLLVDSYLEQNPEVVSIPISANITLTDLFGKVLQKTVQVSFYRSVILLPATADLTFEAGTNVFESFNMDFTEYLPKLGITSEFLASHSDISCSIVATGYMPDGSEDTPFGFEGSTINFNVKTGKCSATLDVLFSSNYPAESYYAILRFVIINPITKDILICADIRQELVLEHPSIYMQRNQQAM